MEEVERRNENDAKKATPILRVCENQFSVQMAGLRKKVSSSPDTNNPVIVLALASSPSINTINVGDFATVTSPYFSKNPSCIFNVNSINVDHKRNGVLKSKAMKRGRENVESCCRMPVVKHEEDDDTSKIVALKGNKRRRGKDVGFGEVLSVVERGIEVNGESSDGTEKGEQHIKDGNLSRVNPTIVLSLASPSISGVEGCQLAQNYTPLDSILDYSVGDDDPAFSPYFSKKNCILNVNNMKCEGINVCSHNSDKKHDNFMGKGDGGAHKRNEVLKSKRRKKDVGYGEVLSVEEREIKEMEQDKKHVGGTNLSIGVSLRVESSDVKKKGKYGTEIGEQHIKEENLSRVNPVIVLALVSPSLSRMKGFQLAQNCSPINPILNYNVVDDNRVVSPYFSKKNSSSLCCILNVNSMNSESMNVGSHSSDKKYDKFMGNDDGQKRYEVLKSKRRKRRRKDVGYVEVLSVEQILFKERGIEVNCSEMEQDKQHVGETNLSAGVSVGKHEDKSQDLEIEKDGDFLRLNVLPKGKGTDKRRQNARSGEVLGVESSDMEKMGKYGTEKGERHIKDGNLSSSKLETLTNADIMTENVILKGKRSKQSGERKIRTSGVTMSDEDTSLVSPYFSKVDDGHGGTMSNENEQLKKKKKKKTRKIKKVAGNDRACNELEREAPCVMPSIVASPYFLADGANDYEKLKSGSMKKGDEEKVKKGRKIKEKRTSLEVDKEVKAEECQRKVTSKSNTIGLPEIKVKDESASDRENNCESHTEPQEATSPFSKTVRRKRVKLRKPDKSQDDPIPPCDKEGSSIKISKKKHKKTLPFAKCLVEGEREDVLESTSMGSRKENCIHNNQRCSQASTSLNVPTDFQKLPVNDKREEQIDEPYCKIRPKRRIDKAALKAFDHLLSNYAYKSHSMNGEGDGGEVSGKLERKKQRRGIAKATLTREEKFAEAYRRKAPNNTWKPPSSPYNLLQEDHSHDPWRVLVICMLLNITTGPQVLPCMAPRHDLFDTSTVVVDGDVLGIFKFLLSLMIGVILSSFSNTNIAPVTEKAATRCEVRKVLSLFFQLCPNAESALTTNEIEIARMIETLGLHRKRAAMIKRLSREYLSHDWTHVTQLHGIGKYAADAYAIFCNGTWDQVTPNDHMLNYYWKYLQKLPPYI